jgi:hypothetical protein
LIDRRAVGALDWSGQPEPDGAGEAERFGGRDAQRRDRPISGDLPDPEERGRVYEAMRAHVSAETRDETSPGRRPDGTDQRSLWTEVSRFFQAKAEQVRKWPTEHRVTVDRSADPAGSYRSDAGAYLNPVRHARTTAAIDRVREAEPKISADVRSVEHENRYGGWLEGFENRRKGEGRLKEKVAEGLATIGPDARPTEILAQVPDAIRYTFCSEAGNYTRGYYDIKERLERSGYQMYESKNSWDKAEYKGINTRWVTPEGQRFEVQLHTPESFYAKEYITHSAYERIRNPLTSDEERAELEEFQREVSSWVQVPEGATDIPDFKKEGF